MTFTSCFDMPTRRAWPATTDSRILQQALRAVTCCDTCHRSRPQAGGSNVAEPQGGGGANPVAGFTASAAQQASSMAMPLPPGAAATAKRGLPAGMQRRHSDDAAHGAAWYRADSCLSPTDNIQYSCHVTCGMCGFLDGLCDGRRCSSPIDLLHLAVTRPGCRGRPLSAVGDRLGCPRLAVARCRLRDTYATQ